MKKIIKVPYYSEFDEIDGSKSHIDIFKRRSCGIVSVKMAIDSIKLNHSGPQVSLSRLIKAALKHRAYKLSDGGTKKNIGWSHSGLIRTLNSLGFITWRKRCFVLPEDIRVLKSQGVVGESIKKYKNQAISEFLFTVSKSIDRGFPVLVSIEKNLGKKVTPHLVVITGYELSKDKITNLYINDPNNPKKNGKRKELINEQVARRDFVKMWRKTAIFIEK